MPDRQRTIEDILFLYELSLAVGRNLDPVQNCDAFISVLLNHRNFSYAAVWIFEEVLQSSHSGGAHLFFASPKAKANTQRIAGDHPLLALLAEEPGMMSINRDDLRYKTLLLDNNVTQGSVTLLRLGDIGCLELHSASTQVLDQRRLMQLRDVTTKLATVLQGAFAHQRLLKETAERKQSEARLVEAIESIPNGFFYYDANQRLIHCNQRYREMYPWLDDALVSGVPFEAVVRSAAEKGPNAGLISDVEEWVRERLSLWQTGRKGCEQYLHDGRWILCSESRTRDGGLVGIRTDITERKKTSEELERHRDALQELIDEQTRDLIEAKDAAEAASQAKDEFLASMSHELRTPLHAILGLSEVLQYDLAEAPEEQQRYLQTIQDSGQHLLTLINDILDIARVETGKLELHFTQVDIESVCQASLQFIKQTAAQKHHRIAMSIDSTADTLWADERRLKQILVNLLSNAVKFTPKQGSVGLEVDRKDESVQFIVWDTGIGIAEDAMKRLFKPFVQLDNRFSREHDGSGLGLSLVYHMVELHGGSITVASEVGQGSRFTVSLPVKQSDLAEAKASTPSVREELSSITAGTSGTDGQAFILKDAPAGIAPAPLILLVEDNESNISVLSAHLQLQWLPSGGCP